VLASPPLAGRDWQADSTDYPSRTAIWQLDEFLDTDENELLLLAGKVPKKI
jgi:hypothetical protein